jgi:hypothetical protein
LETSTGIKVLRWNSRHLRGDKKIVLSFVEGRVKNVVIDTQCSSEEFHTPIQTSFTMPLQGYRHHATL